MQIRQVQLWGSSIESLVYVLQTRSSQMVGFTYCFNTFFFHLETNVGILSKTLWWLQALCVDYFFIQLSMTLDDNSWSCDCYIISFVFICRVVELTGDVTPDVNAIARADVIVTTPEKWDGVSRSWQNRNYVKAVSLIVIDEIHLLGELLDKSVSMSRNG